MGVLVCWEERASWLGLMFAGEKTLSPDWKGRFSHVGVAAVRSECRHVRPVTAPHSSPLTKREGRVVTRARALYLLAPNGALSVQMRPLVGPHLSFWLIAVSSWWLHVELAGNSAIRRPGSHEAQTRRGDRRDHWLGRSLGYSRYHNDVGAT